MTNTECCELRVYGTLETAVLSYPSDAEFITVLVLDEGPDSSPKDSIRPFPNYFGHFLYSC